ncbi:Hint domain-containing protein [Thalassococcus sp. BH17M4-6]|uniref:Hint domain-containing protein n=1 Tax=Thalassococcus sp. BH17M4-6 TaxID=3413148 RepID=UPI003BDD1A63
MKPKTAGRASGEIAAETRVQDSPITNALVAGTSVLTLDGALPAEYLSPGDRVITRDSGMAVLRRARVLRRTVRGVGIQAGSLGNMRPDRDAILPASQQVLIRDWRAQALFGRAQALVPAQRLIDGEFICDLGVVDLTLVELVFDAPHILYADGLELAACLPQPAGA